MPWFIQLMPVVLVSLPFYYFDLYLKRKIEPRKSFKKFLLYIVIMLPGAFIYFILVMVIFIKVLQLKH